MTQQTPAKQSNTIYYILGGIIVVMLVCLCCVVISYLPTSTSSSESQSPNIFSTDVEVKYVINGSASSALITYFNETGGMEQINAGLPWSKNMTVPIGSSLSLVAQNSGSGSITCEIWMNGEKIKSSTSTAQYGVVTCADFAH